jgi:hypothetical protein
MRLLRVARLSALLAGLVLACAASSASAATTPVSIVLRPAQIGPGYQLRTRSDSNCVTGCVTLDLCGYAFTTEPLRTARAQLNYLHAEPAVQISNEVVTYRKGGAAKALAEVRRAVARCPRTPVASSVKGVPALRYRLTRVDEPGLLPASIALQVHVQGTQQGKAVSFTDIYVYQVRGTVLSVVYAYPGAGITVKQQLAVARRASLASAGNLRRAIP